MDAVKKLLTWASVVLLGVAPVICGMWGTALTAATFGTPGPVWMVAAASAGAAGLLVGLRWMLRRRTEKPYRWFAAAGACLPPAVTGAVVLAVPPLDRWAVTAWSALITAWFAYVAVERWQARLSGR